MSYAEVVVNQPLGRVNTTFHYLAPAGLGIAIGHLVIVPFGQRQLQGIVIGVQDVSPVEDTREVISLCDPEPFLTPVQVQVARWISQRYCCSLLEALKLFIPPEAQRRSYLVLEVGATPSSQHELSSEESTLLELLARRGPLTLAQVRAELSLSGLDRAVQRLGRLGIISRRWELSPGRMPRRARTEVRLTLGVDHTDALQRLSRAPRQLAAFQVLVAELEASAKESGEGGWTPLETLRADTGIQLATLRQLEGRGLIETREASGPRPSISRYAATPSPEPALTSEQAAAWEPIKEAIRTGDSTVFLLHGVTGSGKTEIYLRAVREALERGRQAIVLVPEIALTPQTLHRFASRFPGRVAVLHSQLSLPERREEWRRLREGEADVVIGPRSALFAPVPSPGIVVVDEEHEWSYKQEETPRYHARAAALKLASLVGAPTILGSATPDVSSYYQAVNCRFRLLELRQRVETEDVQEQASFRAPIARRQALPPVEVVDLRKELRAGNTSIFSRALLDATAQALAAREQVILYLNRRGAATMLMCRDCGHVMRCRRCDVSLVYHSEGEELVCHLCNRRRQTPGVCPNCREGRLRFVGAGTQRVEEEIRQLFPQARVARWDRDAIRSGGSYGNTLARFVRREVDILVGTQMIAKGLDLPLVTLVGVISGDTVLHLPDFRAAERSFQLLTQVAGRAGRGAKGGRVILQTYSPDHYCIQAASMHDYATFYAREMEFRRQHGYVPYAELVRLIGSGTSEKQVRTNAEEIAGLLRTRIGQLGLAEVEVIGPAPRYIHRVRGRYRWQVLLQGRNLHSLLHGLTLPVGWVIDVDPVTTL